MLYQIGQAGKLLTEFRPIPFMSFSKINKVEKDLEQLLASNLQTIFEESPLMTISQERRLQPEADIYALDANGDLVLFELKREAAGAEALHQSLRYMETAGLWDYSKLESMYRTYKTESDSTHLNEAHQLAFQLARPLDPSEFNKKQRIVIIANGANDHLTRVIDFWKCRGLPIDYVPYRVYEIAGHSYLEVYSHPYDRHVNPALRKGVIFDTNVTYDETGLQRMIEQKKLLAFGDAKGCIDYVSKGDIVFLSHRGAGLVAAAEAKAGTSEDPEHDARARNIRFLTKLSDVQTLIKSAIPFSTVSQKLGKRFYWARTIKVPYLSSEEANILLEAFNEKSST